MLRHVLCRFPFFVLYFWVSEGLYAILGMGAVAGAVIGAPISTAVMVFELTGGYTLSLALLLTVSIAMGVNQAIHGHSFFQWPNCLHFAYCVLLSAFNSSSPSPSQGAN